ncbi:GGDEF domain-containing protein [Marinobacterium jannaschii]|uniref:GGDEF domain-containing protein n=1 Tax=Marinobacterium jannaschii TaxID=64970 RepID=UPI000481986A|nr:GGDEF domain-containing protein [Marinobacterium jannaschii]
MIFAKDDWKLKYQDLAKEFRTLERAAKRRETASHHRQEIMQQVIRRLVLEAQGQEQRLDTRLEELLLALDSGETAPLKKAARKLDKSLRLSQDKRRETAEQLLVSIRRWISELKALSQQELTSNALEAAKNRSIGAVHHYYELPSLLGCIVKLQGEIMDGMADPDSPYMMLARGGLMDEDTQSILRQVATELLDLIDGLHLNSRYRQDALQLIGELEADFELSQLPPLMHRVITLVVQSNQSVSEEFEHYLLDIGDQLTGMHNALSRDFQIAQNDSQRRLLFSQQMQDNFSAMNTATVNGASLPQLKTAIAEKLSQMQKSVTQLKSDEVTRQQESNRRHQKLVAQMNSMEEEARQTMLQIEEERLRSRVDPLTKLANRTAYNERIQQELRRLPELGDTLTLAVCDIDHFKQVNDNYGHLAGDKALRLMANILTDTLRKSDFVGRYGGEEFVLILPATPALEAAHLLEGVREAVAASPFNFSGQPVPITISIGLTEAAFSDNSDTLFARADELLYKAKREGRNRLCSDIEGILSSQS